MAVGQRALDRDGLLAGRQHGATLEQGAQTFEEGRRPVAEIEQRAFLDLVAVTIALAQKDGGGRIAVGDGLDVHGLFIANHQQKSIGKYEFTWLHFGGRTKTSRVKSMASRFG